MRASRLETEDRFVPHVLLLPQGAKERAEAVRKELPGGEVIISFKWVSLLATGTVCRGAE